MRQPGVPDLRHPAPALSLPAGSTLREYVESLRKAGVKVSQGSGGAYWVASGGVVRRLPTFHVGTPGESEADHALRTTGALIASYVHEPDEDHAANAWLYLCRDHDYSLRKVAPAMRRNVHRAMRELTIVPLAATELLAHGGPAFCDTRRRNGLDDGTLRGFRRYFASRGRISRPGTTNLGAWKNGELAAFATVLHLDDWAELRCFSMDSMLRHRPNDALLYVVLSQYLVKQECRVVSFGLSSIQANTSAAGLHRFKRKVGFGARRVHRAFVLHPFVRPLANRVALTVAHRMVNAALVVRPRDRRLRKLGGVLACMRGATWMMDAAERNGGARRGVPRMQREPLGTT